MAGSIKVGGIYKTFGPIYTKVDGGWKKVKTGHIKVDGVWKLWFIDELNDTFDRTNASVLGTSTSGSEWVLRRGTWAISGNKAQSTSAKSGYPLATVDLGLTSFTARANELTPGMGIAFNVVDSNNWMAVVPYYNQTSYSFNYCAQSGTESYCIEPRYGTETYCTGAEIPETVCTTVPGECIRYGTRCAPGCSVQSTTWTTVCQTCTGTRSVCLRYCNFANGTRCCDRDTETYTYSCNCYKAPVSTTSCVCYEQYCREREASTTTCSTQVTCTGIYATRPIITGCAVSGTRSVCLQTGTGTGYNQYFYLRVLAMEGGVIRVVKDVEVNQRFTALQVSGDISGYTINAYSDNNYANLVSTTTQAPITLGTSFGIVGTGSAFEEGTTIGAISVKQLG
jgi:hypothetical protein